MPKKKRPPTFDKLILRRDPSTKGGIRVYTKNSIKSLSNSSRKRRADPNDNFGKGPIAIACDSKPPCHQLHPSKEEATFCSELSKVIANQPDNWHIEINGKKFDYFLNKRIFIEHCSYYRITKAPKDNRIIKNTKITQDKKKKEKIREYVSERRVLLDSCGYKDSPLIVVNLRSKLRPTDLPDKAYFVTSIEELEEILEKLV